MTDPGAPAPPTPGGLLAELRRRGVVRAVVGYAVAAFAALQVSEPLLHALHLPDGWLTGLVVLLALGFPVVAAVSWAYDLTSRGLVRTEAAEAAVPGSPAPPRAWRGTLAAVVLASAALGAGLAWVALKTPAPPIDPDGRLRIAVADFANETRDPELDGLSWMLVNSLAESRKLSVVTRTRMVDELRKMGRQAVPVLDEAEGRDAARALGVRRLVLAAVRRLGDDHAIDLRVLDPLTGEYLFALRERGTGRAAVLALIDRISQRTRERLQAERREEIDATSTRVAGVTTENLEAWHHYALGRAHEDAFRGMAALAEYRRAVALDPDFALAHYRIVVGTGPWSLLSVSDTERSASTEAVLQGAARLPSKERRLARALRAKVEGRPVEALSIARQVAEEDAQDKEVALFAADLAIHQDQLAEALPLLERAVQLDPTWEPALERLVDSLAGLGRAGEVLARAREWAARSPAGATFRALAAACQREGRFAEAVEAARQSLALDPQPASRWTLSLALTWAGRPEEAEQVLAPIFAPGQPRADRDAATWTMLHALEHQGHHRAAMRLADDLSDPAGAQWMRVVILYSGAGRARSDPPYHDAAMALRDARELLRSGVKAGDLVATFVLLGEDGLAAEAARAGPENRLFHEALRAWRRQEHDASLVILRRLAGTPRNFWSSGFFEWWIARVAFDAGRPEEAGAALTAFERAISGPWRASGLAELRLAQATAHDRAGRRDQAIAGVERVLGWWKHADPDLPLLAEAKALCRKVGCQAPQLPRAPKESQ